MQRSDQIGGLALGALGIATITAAARLPAIPGQPIGPAVFPTVIGAGLCLCAILVFLSVGAPRDEAVAPPSPRPTLLSLLRLALPVLILIGYYLAVEPLGFLLSGIALIFATALGLGGRPAGSALLAIGMTIAIHSVFSGLLRVPLPEGILSLPW